MKKGGVGALIERKKRKEFSPVAKAKTSAKTKPKPAKGAKRSKSDKGKMMSDAATGSLSFSSQNDDDAPRPCKESQLELQPWFFGAIPREEAQRKLKTVGSFICRLELDIMGKEAIVLSVVAPGGNVVHCPVNVLGTGAARTFALDGDRHESVHALVSYLIRAEEPVCKGTDVRLKKGIRRPAFWLRSNSVKEMKMIGQGRYGDVVGCNVHMASETEGDTLGMWVEAQLKKSRPQAPESELCAMVAEAKLLRSLAGQDSVVKLIGLVADKFPMGLVLELKGEPLSVRIAKRTLTDLRRIQLLFELAGVAELLSSKRILHRCIRAANCYLGPASRLRLGEFSWAKRGRSYRTWSTEEKVPPGMAHWAASEALSGGEQSPASDMWSVGVVGWELWADGAEPWAFVDDVSLEAKLRGGERLSTASMSAVPGLGPAIQRCWDQAAATRPSAAAFRLQLVQIQKSTPAH